MSDKSSAVERAAPGRTDSDEYWLNKRDSRGSLTSIADADIERGHAPYKKRPTKANEEYWDNYYANVRDSRGSLGSQMDRDMFAGRPMSSSRPSSLEEERLRRRRLGDPQGPPPNLDEGSKYSRSDRNRQGADATCF